ncbi:MAG: hypothetical protein GYB31_16920 [Bacteroidetes bacterium]|nr:hypothetical protein [Bacteroidota bacterium]
MKTKTLQAGEDQVFTPESMYHVYNRTNNKENLFYDEADRWRFLHTYRKYLVPIVKTYSYCLLDNHFHLQVRIKKLSEILTFCRRETPGSRTKYQDLLLQEADNESNMNEFVINQFSRLFVSYAKYFNCKYNRKGNLFNRPFKRKRVNDEAYFKSLICYIHTNPTKHYGLKNFMDYPWSSFQPILNGDVFIPMEKQEVFSVIGAKKEFIKIHEAWTEDMISPAFKLE